MRMPPGSARAAALKALIPAALAFAAGAAWTAQRDKDKEPETQTLELPKELPAAVSGNARRLAFHVTPLSAKGLLSQQVKDALKAVNKLTGGGTVLRIRAFVAGTGDLRRVRDLVSETFTGRRKPLPALSLVQAGALPLTGSQVVMEIESEARKDVNPHGLAWISAQQATSPDPLDPVPPLTAKSLAALRQAVRAAGADLRDVTRVTCFFSSLENLAASRALVEADYPRAALNYVQAQRAPARAMAACEAVARLPHKPGARLGFAAVSGAPSTPGESQVALVAAPRVVLTGTQVSFGYEEKDARLALSRLRASLEQAGASAKDVACARYYSLATSIAEQVRGIRGDFFDPGHAPAGALLLFEGLPSMDAGFAVDAVAVTN